MELTKEYLDSKLEGLATKADLAHIEEILERFATKQDLELMGSTTRHVYTRIDNRSEVSDDVSELKKQMQEVRDMLKLA